MNLPPPDPLFTPKELAALLKRDRTYIFAMKRRGFPMPGNRATLGEARKWLAKHPPPRSGEGRRVE